MALKVTGREGQVLVEGEISSHLTGWVLEVEDGRPAEEGEDPRQAGRAVLTVTAQEPDEFWAQYDPTEVRLRVGTRYWVFTHVTAISPTSLLLAGTPEVLDR